MGRIITLSTKVITPTQPDLYDYKFKNDVWCYVVGRVRDIPIFPVRFNEEENNYLVLDGHHRAVLADLNGRDLKVYLAEHEDDYLKAEEAPNIHESNLFMINYYITKRFCQIFNDREELKKVGIRTIKALRIKNGFGDMEELIKMFGFDKGTPSYSQTFHRI